MLIFKESGRLGNQLFQYACVRSLSKPNEQIVLLGFKSLKETFDGIEAEVFDSKTKNLQSFFLYKFYGSINFLSENRFFSRLSELKDAPQVKQTRGLVDSLAVVQESFFQGESFFDFGVIKSLHIKKDLLMQAQQIINDVTKSKIPIFIHIRRGDYLVWPYLSFPAVLPASYYIECINMIRSKIENSFLFFVSDDIFYVKDIFGELEDSYISEKSDIEDFALMTLCQGGVLSASSFSWWTAYLSSFHHGNDLFFAPQYWAGHRIGEFYPKFIKSDFLKYVDV